MSANPGEPVKPVSRVASGGELSRISLAVQVAAARRASRTCLIFDEVDAGIGGGVAEIVGRKLRELGERGQVLCVTHLAQVASQAHHQLPRQQAHRRAHQPHHGLRARRATSAWRNSRACWAASRSRARRASTRARC